MSAVCNTFHVVVLASEANCTLLHQQFPDVALSLESPHFVVGNWDITTYTTIPDHNIQLTAQGMAQTLRAVEHLYGVIGNDGCSPDCRVAFYVHDEFDYNSVVFQWKGI
ncbi:Phosphoglycerate mutase-like protein AT74 [Glycine max]|nr:Phosphoglycerate mutase-like protein AT74 [Glycine max]